MRLLIRMILCSLGKYQKTEISSIMIRIEQAQRSDALAIVDILCEMHAETDYRVPRKASEAGFSRYPAGLVYWGKGYKSTAYDTADNAPSPKPPSR